MLNLDVWGKKVIRILRPENDNEGLEPSYLNAKALYDEAYEHLKLYETLYARAHAVDMACRRQTMKGRL